MRMGTFVCVALLGTAVIAIGSTGTLAQGRGGGPGKAGWSGGQPPGFTMGQKRGWIAGQPPGFTRGKKKGWQDRNVPPGWLR